MAVQRVLFTWPGFLDFPDFSTIFSALLMKILFLLAASLLLLTALSVLIPWIFNFHSTVLKQENSEENQMIVKFVEFQKK